MKIHAYADIFPMLDDAELKSLAADIVENGLICPILTYEGKILDGRNRFRACEIAGVEPDFEEYSGDDALKHIIGLNLHRRHLTTSQRAMVAASLATLKDGERQVGKFAEVITQPDAAKLLNVSTRSVTTAAKIRDEGVPELSKAVLQGSMSVREAETISTAPKERQKEILKLSESEILEAAKEIRTERSAVRRAENNLIKTAALKIKPPTGLYRTIVIDPPWDMKKIERDVRPNQVEFDYPTMTQEELMEFKIPAHEDSHLYLWTTHKQLPNAFELMKKWGFGYIFTMVWHKNGGPQPFGLAQYNCEFCLFGRRGGLEFLDTKAFMTCFNAPRREHSRKPDEFYDLVARVSPSPRIDIFSREERKEFDQYGAETELFNGQKVG